jgi:hypothetical protein
MTAVIALACLRPSLAQHLVPLNSAAKSPPPAASPDKLIEKAIADLGSSSYLVRENASRQLWSAGADAQAALEKAVAQSDDFEVVTRARQIVDMFHLGVYPDTPRDLVEQIASFRLGSYRVKQRIGQELLNAGKRDLVRRLVELEPNPRMRQQLSRMFPLAMGIEGAMPTAGENDISLAVRTRLAQGNFASAERLLRNSTGDDMTREYAALLLSRGRLDATITQMRAKPGPVDKSVQRQLAWMLRAKGDLAGAVAAAKAAKDVSLVESLQIELGDWKELAKTDANVDVNKLDNPLTASQKLARIITFRHLAGDKKSCDAAVAAAIARFKHQPMAERKLFDALILNDRVDQLVDACAKEPMFAFDLLASQGRLQDAFRQVKIDVRPRDKFDWKAWLKAGGADVDLEHRFLAHHVLRALFRVGEDERAAELFAATLSVVNDRKSDNSWQQEPRFLIDVAVISARADTCDELAAKVLALKLEEPERVVATLYYRQQNSIAAAVWRALRNRSPGEEQAAALKHLRLLLAGSSDVKAAAEFTALLPRIETELSAVNPAAPNELLPDARAGKLLALAALLHRYDQDKLSAKYLARVAPAEVSSQMLIELGDRYAEQMKWSDAIRAYDAACTKDRRNASALFLLGWAKIKNGKEAEGRKDMDLALVIPLADGESRHSLAQTLARLHNDEEAARQRQLVLRLAGPHETSIIRALADMCDAETEKPQASGMTLISQRLAAEFLLSQGVFQVETRFYIQWRAMAHRFAARELLCAGNTAAAIEEIHRAEAIMPEDVELALDCDAELRKRGAATEADALYHRMADRLESDSRLFPHYATSRNDLAWMAANLDRDLDMALSNARRAVELAPQSAGILDTLAEVQFRRGNRAKAVQLARRCIELDSDRQLYKDRLARFKEVSGTSPSPTASTRP